MTKQPSKKFVSMCPKRKSTNVVNDFSNPAAASYGTFVDMKICNDCNYKGKFFPEIETDK